MFQDVLLLETTPTRRKGIAVAALARPIGAILVCGALVSCIGSRYPPTEAGARALLTQFLRPGADLRRLTLALKPRSEDYRRIFASDVMAKRAEVAYDRLWQQARSRPITPKTGQTEVIVWRVSTDELKSGTGNAELFPTGYRSAAPFLRAGLTVYRWKFVEPGKTYGLAFDGLYPIGRRWVLIAKPWQVLPGQAPGNHRKPTK